MVEVIPSVLVSSAILAIAGFALAVVTSNEMVKALGILIGRGALIPLVLVNLCLPALLFFVDKLLPVTTYRADFYDEPIVSKRVLNEFDLDVYYDGKTKSDVQKREETENADYEQEKGFLLGMIGTEDYSDQDDSDRI